MTTTKPTKEESAWMKKVQKLLENPPSGRIGFYVTGDSCLFVYNREREDEIHNLMDRRNADFCVAVNDLGASLGIVYCAFNIHSTSA